MKFTFAVAVLALAMGWADATIRGQSEMGSSEDVHRTLGKSGCSIEVRFIILVLCIFVQAVSVVCDILAS